MRIIEVPPGWETWLRIVADVTPRDIDRHLSGEERADVDRLRVEERRLERAASRIAGKLLLTDVMRLDDPRTVEFAKVEDRPFVRLGGSNVSMSVSFTHSHGLGGAAAADTPVGVDLEKRREIRPEMTRFFLSSDELSSARDLELRDPLLHFWSAKEAAFKLSPAFPTLLRVPLELTDVLASGLTFRVAGSGTLVETRVLENDFIVALARTQ